MVDNVEHPNIFIHIKAGELLHSSLQTPFSTLFYCNLINKRPAQNIDLQGLVLQHGTSGFKILMAEKFQKDITKYVEFYRINVRDAGEKRASVNFMQVIEFQLALECFFLFAWGAIASVSREIFYSFQLSIEPRDIYFHKVKDTLKKYHDKEDFTNYLVHISEAEWLKYLNGARNRVEHGQIPTLEHRPDGSIVLADDQRTEISSITATKNYEVVAWSATLLAETNGFMESCYRAMNKYLFK